MADSELIVNISIITIQSMLMPTRLMKKIDLEKAEYKEENSNTGNLRGVITLFISIYYLSPTKLLQLYTIKVTVITGNIE
jgi:hydrogenase-4 membrane subunit HyfE